MLNAGSVKTASALRPLGAILLLAVAAGLIFIARPQGSSGCSASYRQDKKIRIGKQTISAEVASTAQAKNKGLGGRACIGSNESMLFVFSKPGQYAFWMKDMKFPIDMVWISSSHIAVVVQENVQPSTYPDSFENPADKPAQYFLELKAHGSTNLDINPGTPINF